MLSNQIQFLLVFSISTQIVNASRILMVTLAGTKSHKIPFVELGKGLSERGHNLTFVNAFPTDSPNPLIDEINPTNLVMYIKNFTNWDLLGPKLRGQMPVPIIDIFKFGYEVRTHLIFNQFISLLCAIFFSSSVKESSTTINIYICILYLRPT